MMHCSAVPPAACSSRCPVVQATCLCALLQPAPEVFDLFDDVLLLCDGEAAVLSSSAPALALAALYQPQCLASLASAEAKTTAVQATSSGLALVKG